MSQDLEMNAETVPRRKGRAARRAAREARQVTWLPPLERGLPYLDIVTPDELERIHDASMRILEEIGIEFRDDEAIAMWKAAGTSVDGYRVRIDRHQLMELVSTAPSEYTMQSRAEGHVRAGVRCSVRSGSR